MKRASGRLMLLWALLLAAAPGMAATPTDDADFQRRLAIGHQFAMQGELVKDSLTPPRWLSAGDRFVHWAASGAHAGTWTIVDARTGARTPLLSSASLRAQLAALPGGEAPLPDSLDFALAPDERELVFALQGRPFSLDFASGRVAALPPGSPLAALLDGGTSPDGGMAAIAEEGGGIAVLAADGRRIAALRGEQDRRWELPSKAWSPDSRYVLVAEVDERHVHKIPIVDYRTPIETVAMHPYPKAGTPLAKTRHHILDTSTGRTVAVAEPSMEAYAYPAGWRPDGSEALILYLSRDGKRLDLAAVDPQSGAARLVIREERPESFVGALDFAPFVLPMQVTPLGDNRRLLWASERNGWRNLYLYDFSGRPIRPVTGGRLVVHQVLKTAARDVYLLASADADRPYDRHLYRVPLRGGPAERLTRESGIHQITLAPSGRYFTDSHASRERARTAHVVSIDGRRRFQFGEADTRALLAIGYTPPEGFVATAADGVTPIHGVIFKPRDFDPAKRYPVVNHIYQGPWLSVVPWAYPGSQAMRGTLPYADASATAQLGFVVVMVDGRGTPGRSKAFQDASYGRIGQIEIPDQIAAIRQAAASRPYMDLDRVGIMGHSWGGYYVLRGMVTAPDFYKAGYAGAPGSLWEDALINEPNLGLPGANPAAYAAGSNEPLAGRLKGALKIMHGTSDVNASLSSTMRMAEALIKAGKHFDLLIMPGQPHRPTPPFYRYYFDDRMLFLAAHLGGPR